MSNKGNPGDGIGVQLSVKGKPLGNNMLLPLFVPDGQNIIMQAADMLWYEIILTPNGNGTGTLSLQQVTL
jgi:hypothetical protein